LRVLLQRPAPDYFGGGVVHAEKTREYLAALGVEADYTFDLEPDLAGYDIVHLLSAPKFGDLFTQCANVQRQSRPLVLSPIYWDGPALMRCTTAEEPPSPAAVLDHMFGNQLYAAMLGEADVVLTASSMEQGWLARDFGIAEDKQRVVPLAAEPFFATADEAEFVRRFGVRDFILCSAQLARSKNQLRLIRALRGFPQPLVLAYVHAEPDYEQRCRDEAGENVVFLGRLDQRELASAYAAAKVHVLVSCYEPTGLANLEAGLAGCNLVCTAHSPIVEYMGDRAWYADPCDLASIRRAVELAHRVPRSHILRNELLVKFTWEHTAQLTLAAYEALLAAPAALGERKGETRYRWLTSYRANVARLRAEALAAARPAEGAPGDSASAAAQAEIDYLHHAVEDRDAQLRAVTGTLGYRLHHLLATGWPGRALRRLRDAGPLPVFRAPRGPALDALAGRPGIKRALILARASAWHVRRALSDLRRALPEASVVIAAADEIGAALGDTGQATVLPLTRQGYSEVSGLHDAIIVVGEVTGDAVRLAERSGAALLVQYNTQGYFAGSPVIAAPRRWRRSLRAAEARKPMMRAAMWVMSRVAVGYITLLESMRGRPRIEVTCVGCGARVAMRLLWHASDRSAYVRCPSCGLSQVASPPPDEELIGIYEGRTPLDDYLQTRTDSVTRFRHERILAHIERWVAPGRLLDIGCADGRFLEIARDAGWRIEGLETSSLLAREAEKLVGPVIHTAILQEASLPDNRFDAVDLSHVIEHVRDPRGLLREVRRILKPGGVVALSTPNVASLAALVLGGRWHQICPSHHVPLFAPRTLRALVRACGFQILEAETVAVGRVLGALWTPRLFAFLPGDLRRRIIRREPQLNEYLADVGMGEELLLIARKPV